MGGFLKILFFFSFIQFYTSIATSKTIIVTDVAVFTSLIAAPDSSLLTYHIDGNTTFNGNLLLKLQLRTKENRRLTAFCLAVFLGHFGVHRLYLGTKPIIPISYVLTLGGGLGVLPAIDAVVILFSKDLEKFENNSSFFMWSE